jgi:hypothetical protein
LTEAVNKDMLYGVCGQTHKKFDEWLVRRQLSKVTLSPEQMIRVFAF